MELYFFPPYHYIYFNIFTYVIKFYVCNEFVHHILVLNENMKSVKRRKVIVRLKNIMHEMFKFSFNIMIAWEI